MFSLNNLQIIVDDHLDILLNRLANEDMFADFFSPNIKPYFRIIFAWFAFFTILFLSLDPFFKNVWKNKYYLRLNSYRKKSWNSRVIAFIHAAIVAPFSVYLVCHYGYPWNKSAKDYDAHEINLYYSTICISIGYFIWDVIYSISDYRKGGIGFVIHGICALLIYVFTFKHHVLGHYSIMYLTYELSTIFLHIYWVLDKVDLTGSTIQVVDGIIVSILFLSVRIIFGNITITRLLYDLIFVRKVCSVYLSLFFFLNIIPMQVLNLIWFYKMIQSILKRTNGPSEKPSEKPSKKRSEKESEKESEKPSKKTRGRKSTKKAKKID